MKAELEVRERAGTAGRGHPIWCCRVVEWGVEVAKIGQEILAVFR